METSMQPPANTDTVRTLERLRQNAAYVAEISVALSESLDYDHRLYLMTHLLVPQFAALCFVDLTTDNIQLKRAALHHKDSSLFDAIERLRPISVDKGRIFLPQRVVEREIAEIIPEMEEYHLAMLAHDYEQIDTLRRLKIRSCICVPLSAHVHTIGALTLLRDATTESYTRADLDLAQDIARCCAIAIDNAVLHRKLKMAVAQRDYALSVVSHDLRNALSGISVCAAILEDTSVENEEGRRFLRSTIRQSANWMHRIIGDLLDFASIESGKLSFKPAFLDPIIPVAHTLNLFEHRAKEKDIQIITSIPEHLPKIWGDEARLVQVFLNLLANALRFAPEKGEILLKGELNTGEPKDVIVFSVSNNGPGIPLEHVPHIFDPFWHTPENGSEKGLGLGLAIAKGIVEVHGGQIWVASDDSNGTTFSFTVPLLPPSTNATI